jgi:hypothetical protein
LKDFAKLSKTIADHKYLFLGLSRLRSGPAEMSSRAQRGAHRLPQGWQRVPRVRYCQTAQRRSYSVSQCRKGASEAYNGAVSRGQKGNCG